LNVGSALSLFKKAAPAVKSFAKNPNVRKYAKQAGKQALESYMEE
jgi:hypothetical protein